MANLKNAKLIYAKGTIFLLIGVISAALILLPEFNWKLSILLAVCIWSFCRFYYFAFYVIQHYVDDQFRFAGLFDFARFLVTGKAGRRGEPDPD